MAATAVSYVNMVTEAAALNNTVALDMSAAGASAFKCALFGNAGSTPVVSTDNGKVVTPGGNAWTDQLAAGSGYTAGGTALTTPLYQVNTAVSGQRTVWKNGVAYVEWTSFTGTPYAANIYQVALDIGIVAYTLGGAQAVSSGTLRLTFHSLYTAGTMFYKTFNAAA
jgi:hypothetical protein